MYKYLKCIVFTVIAIITISALADSDKKEKTVLFFCVHTPSKDIPKMMLDNLDILYENGFRHLLIEYEEKEATYLKKQLIEFKEKMALPQDYHDDYDAYLQYNKNILDNTDYLLKLIDKAEEKGISVQGLTDEDDMNSLFLDNKKFFSIIEAQNCFHALEDKDFIKEKDILLIFSRSSCRKKMLAFYNEVLNETEIKSICEIADNMPEAKDIICIHSKNNNCFSFLKNNP